MTDESGGTDFEGDMMPHKLDSPIERAKADYESPLSSLLMALMLGCANVLLLFEGTREFLYVWVGLWNLVVIFILSSFIMRLRFG